MKMEIKIAFITHQIGKTPKKKKRLLFGKATGNSRMMGIKIRTISMKENLTVTKKNCISTYSLAQKSHSRNPYPRPTWRIRCLVTATLRAKRVAISRGLAGSTTEQQEHSAESHNQSQTMATTSVEWSLEYIMHQKKQSELKCLYAQHHNKDVNTTTCTCIRVHMCMTSQYSINDAFLLNMLYYNKPF